MLLKANSEKLVEPTAQECTFPGYIQNHPKSKDYLVKVMFVFCL